MLALTPSALSCSATLTPASTDRLVRTTRDPEVARALTVSTPMPELPPVTKDVFPAGHLPCSHNSAAHA